MNFDIAPGIKNGYFHLFYSFVLRKIKNKIVMLWDSANFFWSLIYGRKLAFVPSRDFREKKNMFCHYTKLLLFCLNYNNNNHKNQGSKNPTHSSFKWAKLGLNGQNWVLMGNIRVWWYTIYIFIIYMFINLSYILHLYSLFVV